MRDTSQSWLFFPASSMIERCPHPPLLPHVLSPFITGSQCVRANFGPHFIKPQLWVPAGNRNNSRPCHQREASDLGAAIGACRVGLGFPCAGRRSGCSISPMSSTRSVDRGLVASIPLLNEHLSPLYQCLSPCTRQAGSDHASLAHRSPAPRHHIHLCQSSGDEPQLLPR